MAEQPSGTPPPRVINDAAQSGRSITLNGRTVLGGNSGRNDLFFPIWDNFYNLYQTTNADTKGIVGHYSFDPFPNPANGSTGSDGLSGLGFGGGKGGRGGNGGNGSYTYFRMMNYKIPGARIGPSTGSRRDGNGDGDFSEGMGFAVGEPVLTGAGGGGGGAGGMGGNGFSLDKELGVTGTDEQGDTNGCVIIVVG